MSVYTPAYYERHLSGATSSAQVLLRVVQELVSPRSVVDVGCGLGTWLAAWRALGVEDVTGVEGDYVPAEHLEIPADRVMRADLSRPFQLGRTYDLAMSLEVAEHLPAESADGFVDSLAALAPVVLFSAAIPFQGGTGHQTERWPAWWAERFARHGFRALDCLRARVWADERVAPWYAQNALLYVKEERLAADPVLGAIAPVDGSPLALVHPKTYLRRADPARASVSKALRMLRAALSNAVTRRRARSSSANGNGHASPNGNGLPR